MTKLGFMPDEVHQSRAILAGVNLPDTWLLTAMDLSRFCRVALVDATFALAHASAGDYRPLRRYGLEIREGQPVDVLLHVREEVGGQAEAYAKTLHGRLSAAASAVGPRRSSD